jgi:UDP-N-acetylmuramate dehydrogenase
VVINLQNCCNRIFHRDQMVYAGSGALVEELVGYCERHSLAGLDYMSGIPGTVGGALRMNAGAFVGEIGERVSKLEAFTLDGNYLEIAGSEAGFGYRKASRLQNLVLLGCWLNLFTGSQTELEKARKDYLKRREIRQPLDYGSCGSVFKRPAGFYAGELIEKAGLKGRQIGGAMVSQKHANFIINKENATAQDIFHLIKEVQQKVFEKFGIWLELEVKLAGFSQRETESVRKPSA